MIMVPSKHQFQVLCDELMLGCFVATDLSFYFVS
jgi:hypothetical protein